MPDLAHPDPGTWTFDPAHTTIELVARHLMVAKVRGGFAGFTGSLEIAENPTDSKVTIEVDVASVDSGTADRDNHLRSPDFFDVENYPTMKFVSTSVIDKDDGYVMTGDLTLKGVTHPLTLDVEYFGVIADPWGNAKAVFSATGEVNREDWGLTWNQPIEAGGFLVSKHAKIEIDAEAAKAE